MVTFTFVGDVVTNEVVLFSSPGVQVSGATVVWGSWAVYQYILCHVFRRTQEITLRVSL